MTDTPQMSHTGPDSVHAEDPPKPKRRGRVTFMGDDYPWWAVIVAVFLIII
jgi:hypothetical protein